MIRSSIALALVVLVLCLVGLQTSSAQAASIAWELERGFRFFKFNSDFEFQRLASRDFQAKNSNKQPTIVEIDALLDNRDWWDESVDPKLAAWYGHASPVTPLDLLREWRAEEITRGRAPGYLELSLKLKAEHRFYREYHPVRLGWSSLLFPAHQTPEDIGKSQLIDASQVAVCWNREAQRHTNCDQLDPYVVPLQHTVSVRAVDDSGRRILTGNCLWIIEATSGARFVLPRDTEVNRLQIECKEKVAISVPYRHETTLRLTVNDAEVGTVIKVEDVLIVGLGDSFSSGEGNPDVPVKLAWSPDQNVDPITAGNAPIDQVSGGPVRKRAGDYFAAQWIDRSCHRSAYSYQLRSALHLAVSEPHRAITFLGYACSGAEVNEGLFHPHQGPEYTTNKRQMPPWQRSQLPLLLSELCEEYSGRAVRNEPLTSREEQQAISSNQYKLGGVIKEAAYRCASQPPKQGFKRKIDLMYLSIGGNDLGFPRWIMAAIAGEGKLGSFLPVLKDSDAPECAGRQGSCQQTRRRWDSLRARYDLLREVIDNRLAFEDRGVAPILLYSYPLPIKGADKNICPPGNAGLTVFVMQRPGVRICLTDTQRGLPVLETIADFAEQKLNGEVERLAGDKDRVGNLRPKWIVVKNYKVAFDNRSYCASTVRAASGGKAPEEPTRGCLSASKIRKLVWSFSVLTGEAAQESLHLPLGHQEWRPFDPIWDYRPYSHRSRLLRTMNETYFVINQLKAATQGIRASGILSLQDAARYGAFHPTAEAHAIVAEHFFSESATILQAAPK